jgi:NAD-dependent dihydropyrimidine dehydrogenase PreA subunit
VVHSIKIDLNICISCQACVKCCFQDVLRWDEANNVPICVHPEDCQICCLCEENCPVKAIQVIPDWKSMRAPKVLGHVKRQNYVFA